MLTYFLILSAGVSAGFVLCGLLAVNRENVVASVDTGRLNFLESANVTTTVVQGYHAIFPVGVGEPLAMGADLRETIDAARSKKLDELAKKVDDLAQRFPAEEKVHAQGD